MSDYSIAEANSESNAFVADYHERLRQTQERLDLERKKEKEMSDNETELLPCPFAACGGNAVYNDGHVHCEQCGVMSPAFESWDQAFDWWNRRAKPATVPPMPPEIDGLIQFAGKCRARRDEAYELVGVETPFSCSLFDILDFGHQSGTWILSQPHDVSEVYREWLRACDRLSCTAAQVVDALREAGR